MSSRNCSVVEAVVLFTLFVAATYGFGIYLFPAMIGAIRQEMSFSYGAMGTISGLVEAGFMICALLSGVLTVRLGAMPVIFVSITLCAAALLGLGAASSVFMMTLLLTVLGGCAAMIWVPMAEVVQMVVPPKHQGKALGLMSSGTSYGVFCNSLLLGWPLAHWGWRVLWIIAGAAVALLAILSVLRLRRFARSATREKAARDPVRPLSVRVKSLPHPLTSAVLFIMFLNGLSCMPYQNYLSATLEGEAGYAHDFAAHIWGIIGLVGMGSGFAMGALADRITIRWGMVIVHALLAVAGMLILLGLNGAEAPLAITSALLFGVSFYAIFGLVPAYIGVMFKAGDAVLVFSFGNIALGVGGVIGNVLGGWLKVATGSFAAIYLIVVVAALVCVLMSILLRNERSCGHQAIVAAE